MSEYHSDIIICGAGVPGALCALMLADAGLAVTVLEAAQMPAPLRGKAALAANGRTVALMDRAVGVLASHVRLDDLSATPLRRLRIVDDSFWPQGDRAASAMVEEVFDAAEIGLDQFGFNIPLIPLQAAMMRALEAHARINLVCGAKVTDVAFDPRAARVTVQDGRVFAASVSAQKGRVFAAPLVVGADGRESAVRKAADIAVETRDYGASAITCVIAHSGHHDFTSTEFHRPSGPFTVVPMPGNASSIVWVEKTDDAERFMALGKRDMTAALQARTRGLLGDVEMVGEATCWPLIGRRAKALTAPRCALVAEAAHVMSPIGAQGMNLSLRDVEDLVAVIRESALCGLDIGAGPVLERFERLRRTDMAVRLVGVDAFHRSVATRNPLVHRGRRLALHAAAACTPLRLILMREGLSPRGRHSA